MVETSKNLSDQSEVSSLRTLPSTPFYIYYNGLLIWMHYVNRVSYIPRGNKRFGNLL